MAADFETIRNWIQRGMENNSKWLIIVCDDYDHEDYPVFCSTKKETLDKYAELNGKNMQRVMEVYDLSIGIENQLKERRAFHLPK